MTRVLGIEGTAWAASAAVYDSSSDALRMDSVAYQPDSGGIHPREAAEHMHDAIPRVIEAVLADTDDSLDAVAFSRGPGLGPCLRTVGTAARALAGTLDLPLVGVNHMVAHLAIGRHESGFTSPVCLNASGANAHLLGFHDGRYRVLGETMDTGVGNAIDKFARSAGWDHPGGPKVEEAARDGEYVDLPYVVKGMDFSFAGITSAAQEALEDGTPVEDVCRGLQETVFGMLTEVSERALSLTGSDELVLGGGVGQNRRLQGMLDSMCGARGAAFHAPADRFLRDNAGMIAVLGARMYEAGATIPIEDSAVRPDFRPDEVPVTWRSGESVTRPPAEASEIRGAEAVVEVDGDARKRRVPKAYRHPALDDRLRRERTAMEARLTSFARRHGVPTPVLRDVDPGEATLVFERVGTADLGAALTEPRVRAVGEHLAALHAAGVVHGDPTTRNARVDPDAGRVSLIDFGLGYHTEDVEDYAMDLHVFEQSVAGTAADHEPLCRAFEDAYREAGDPAVLDRLREIEGRGRYQGE
ncbi:MAG: bifunctional N(6)-L-threonylcarbamoyladenine synthase/serine/threonine protein kinase [Halobacteriales archaeon]